MEASLGQETAELLEHHIHLSLLVLTAVQGKLSFFPSPWASPLSDLEVFGFSPALPCEKSQRQGTWEAKWKNASKSSGLLGPALSGWHGGVAIFESPLVKYLLSCEGKCCRVKQRELTTELKARSSCPHIIALLQGISKSFALQLRQNL